MLAMKSGVVRITAIAAVAAFLLQGGSVSAQNGRWSPGKPVIEKPLVLKDSGVFSFAGQVITGPDGNTFHGDHGVADYKIPVNPRRFPIVMWHGGGQYARTWQTTPDRRDGFDNILARKGFATYTIDQPRRGRSRSTVGITIPDAVPGEANTWNIFRLGTWVPPAKPTFFANVQFPRDAESLDQYFEQQASNTGPEVRDDATRNLQSNAVSQLFDEIGPGILLVHSNSGQYGWRTAGINNNVRGIVAYEPGTFAFPQSALPPDIETADAAVRSIAAPYILPDSVFNQLTKIPIQIVYGDNIEFNTPSPLFGVELWRVNVQRAKQFVAEINKRGGKAEILHLPSVGLKGNTHFPFSDLNNKKVADLLLKYLARNKLDIYEKGKR